MVYAHLFCVTLGLGGLIPPSAVVDHDSSALLPEFVMD